jgi:hypothetical protein
MRRSWWCWTRASAKACSPSTPPRGPPGDGRNPHNKLAWDLASGSGVKAYPEGIADGCDPALEGHYTLADGTRVAPSFQLLRERVAETARPSGRAITGIPAERIRQLAGELGQTALHQAFELPIPWTDAWGKQHPTTQGRPVAFHAMRGWRPTPTASRRCARWPC